MYAWPGVGRRRVRGVIKAWARVWRWRIIDATTFRIHVLPRNNNNGMLRGRRLITTKVYG